LKTYNKFKAKAYFDKHLNSKKIASSFDI
jgi:hypothetical protein